MTAQVVETIQEGDKTILVYDNGMKRDAATGYLLAGPKDTRIDAEKSTVYHRVRKEQARAAFIEGANEATENIRPDYAPYGDLAYVRAIGYATTTKALNPKDPKQTDAARLALNVGERLDEDGDHAPPASVAAGIAAGVATALERIMRDIMDRQVIDVKPD